jgi:hypothetical protein
LDAIKARVHSSESKGDDWSIVLKELEEDVAMAVDALQEKGTVIIPYERFAPEIGSAKKSDPILQRLDELTVIQGGVTVVLEGFMADNLERMVDPSWFRRKTRGYSTAIDNAVRGQFISGNEDFTEEMLRGISGVADDIYSSSLRPKNTAELAELGGLLREAEDRLHMHVNGAVSNYFEGNLAADPEQRSRAFRNLLSALDGDGQERDHRGLKRAAAALGGILTVGLIAGGAAALYQSCPAGSVPGSITEAIPPVSYEPTSRPISHASGNIGPNARRQTISDDYSLLPLPELEDEPQQFVNFKFDSAVPTNTAQVEEFDDYVVEILLANEEEAIASDTPVMFTSDGFASKDNIEGGVRVERLDDNEHNRVLSEERAVWGAERIRYVADREGIPVEIAVTGQGETEIFSRDALNPNRLVFADHVPAGSGPIYADQIFSNDEVDIPPGAVTHGLVLEIDDDEFDRLFTAEETFGPRSENEDIAHPEVDEREVHPQEPDVLSGAVKGVSDDMARVLRLASRDLEKALSERRGHARVQQDEGVGALPGSGSKLSRELSQQIEEFSARTDVVYREFRRMYQAHVDAASAYSKQGQFRMSDIILGSFVEDATQRGLGVKASCLDDELQMLEREVGYDSVHLRATKSKVLEMRYWFDISGVPEDPDNCLATIGTPVAMLETKSAPNAEGPREAPARVQGSKAPAVMPQEDDDPLEGIIDEIAGPKGGKNDYVPVKVNHRSQNADSHVNAAVYNAYHSTGRSLSKVAEEFGISRYAAGKAIRAHEAETGSAHLGRSLVKLQDHDRMVSTAYSLFCDGESLASIGTRLKQEFGVGSASTARRYVDDVLSEMDSQTRAV